jgi:peptidoglycan/LPS O-acetylase OafA/YrhL
LPPNDYHAVNLLAHRGNSEDRRIILPPTKETFNALNGLRFFASLGVVFFHYSVLVSGFTTLPIFLQRCVHAGPIALEFFYILSGFVLAHAYLNRPPRTTTLRRSFWFARFARLYPVYLLAFGLFLPIAYENIFTIRLLG